MKTKEFFDYLNYIGILTNDYLTILTSIVDNKTKENENNKNIDKTTFMKSLMGDYLTSLNKEQLAKLGTNIYDKYLANKSLTVSKHLSKMFSILNNLFLKNLKSYFIILKKHIIKGKNQKHKAFPRSFSSDEFFNKSNKKKRNISNLNNLYSNNLNNKYIDINNQKMNSDFFERLDKYSTKLESDKKKAKIMNEDNILINCTFSPNLSLTKKRNNKLGGKSRLLKYMTLESPKNIEEKKKRKVDANRVNKLYNDYKTNRKHTEKLQQIFDKEDGITFSPRINAKSQKFNINEDFVERNRKLFEKIKERNIIFHEDKKVVEPKPLKYINEKFYERNKKIIDDKKKVVDGFEKFRDLFLEGAFSNKK